MDSVKKRILYALLLCVCVCAFIALALYAKNAQNKAEITKSPEGASSEGASINVWYYRSELSPYLADAALKYYDTTGIKIIPKLVDGTLFLEKAYEASLSEDGCPDLLITDSQNLEMAALSGMAIPVSEESFIRDASRFSVRAQDSVSYGGQIIGYPLCFETPVFVYNNTYLKEMAKADLAIQRDILSAQMEQERIDEWVAAGIIPDAGNTIEGANEPSDSEIEPEPEITVEPIEKTPEELEAQAKELEEAESYAKTIVPKTIEDILVIAETFDSPEGVEKMFTWDVSDIFFNYFFLGRYIDIGGEGGDNKDIIDIYNEQSMACLRAFNKCSEFFALDPSISGTQHILEDFIAQKTLFAVISSDDLKKLELAGAQGVFEYGVMMLPNLADSLESRGLSVTQTAIVNGFSRDTKNAEGFAKFIADEYAKNLYATSGKIACKKEPYNDNEPLKTALRAYENSAALPKLLETSDFWMKLEIVMSKAWRGEDANDLLRNLSQEVKGQVMGYAVTENYIENPKTIDEIMAEQIEFEEVPTEGGDSETVE